MPEENTTIIQEELPEKKSLAGRLFKYAAAVFAAVLCFAILLFLFRDRIVEIAFCRAGSVFTGTEVKLQEFSSDLSGQIRLKGFSVGNPQGYSTGNAIDLNELFINVDLPSLFQKQKIIRQISLKGLRVNLESSFNDTNISKIQQNIQKSTSSSSKETQAKTAAEEDHQDSGILIEHFASEDGSASYTHTSVEQPIAFLLPPLNLKNIGGSTVKDTANQIVTQLFAFINNAFANAGYMISKPLYSAGKNLIKGTQKTGSSLLKSLKKNINFKKRK